MPSRASKVPIRATGAVIDAGTGEEDEQDADRPCGVIGYGAAGIEWNPRP
jgi:hypothetical protein